MTTYSKSVCIARDYYNSTDADRFYYTIWGGEDIHIGLYKTPDENIFDASRRTVETMARKLSGLKPGAKVIDLGAGFGGAARWLAKEHGCEVVALNLSEAQNKRDREMNKEQGLTDKVDVVDAAFEKLDYPGETFDFVWSQDAILHSCEREKVMSEAARVLKPGGEMVFTDPMMTDDCPTSVLQPILDRVHLDTLAWPQFYKDTAAKLGLEVVEFDDHSHQLPNHYGRVLKELESREDELKAAVSEDYIERMKTGLQHWVEGGNNGHLTWGIFHLRKK
ncbi:methyltransferase domain-containing protein [Desulfohalovibrio reitneri]|uniref:methyltransferase domain-containing protein n=1 Tax=Desulfohalovibrio reitneri TaxID=1307759 RepID=UPI0004A77006|nr:methyltransferase domain-containing protein [Desulfohalovibrio reitneri]